MHFYRLIKKFLMALPLIFLAILVAACGSTTTTAATSTSTSSASACVSVASGLVQSIANNTLLVATRQGKEMQVVYTSATVFMKQVVGKQSDLQEGMRVTAAITQNPDNSYTATLISLRSGSLGRSGFGAGGNGTATPGGVRICGNNGRAFQGGTPGAQGGQRTGSRTRHSLSGTIAQLNGNTLVITDRSGNDISVTLNAATRIINTTSVSASDVKFGDTISATGTTDSSGILHAVQVLIQSGQSATPTPTTTNQ